MYRGAIFFFCRLSRCQKRGFEKKKKVHFFCLFYVGLTKRENLKKGGKGNFQKKLKNSVSWVDVKKKGFFVKKAFFRKICKHDLCSEGTKNAFSLQLSVFEKWSFVWCPFKVTKHYKNRGFSRHGGQPKMALLVAKVPFCEGASKGGLLSVIPKSCALLKTLLL